MKKDNVQWSYGYNPDININTRPLTPEEIAKLRQGSNAFDLSSEEVRSFLNSIPSKSMSIDKEKINSKLKLYPTFFNYRNILIGGFGYDESTITEVCEDVCNFFKDEEEVEEFELDDFIVDRLKEDNLIGFTTDFIIEKLIEEELLEVISMGHKPDELSELLHAIYPISDILVQKAGIEPVYRTFKFKQNKQN